MIGKVLALMLCVHIVSMILIACTCRDPVTNHYRWGSVRLTSYSYYETAEGFKTFPATSNDFRTSAYAVHVDMRSNLLAARYCLPVNAAYALSCADDSYIMEDKITSLQLISLTDYDSAHLAGAEVTSYFQMPDSFYTNDHDETADGAAIGLSAKHMCYLLQKPTLGRSHRFECVMTVNGIPRFRDTTEELLLR